MLFRKLHGVAVPHRKNTGEKKPVIMPPPNEVILPVSMHIGAPAVPSVKVGDAVAVGDVIATAGGFVSAPVHASVSGTVKAIGKIKLANGNTVDAITISSDGEMRVSSEVVPLTINSFEDFVAAVRNSGIVGLGGAGFPTSVKLGVKDLSAVKTVLINGAECEPYITSDTRTMIDDAEWMEKGFALLQKYMNVGNIIVGIEKNKPRCIAEMRKIEKKNPAVKVAVLPSLYPQGGEKVLIYHTTGKVVPEGKLPIDVGVVVLNCTTLASLAKYIETGMPLVSKCVTVDGGAVANPQNVILPIGTKIGDLFEFCGGFKEEPAKILNGGPMMGIALPDVSFPVMKSTNAVLAFSKKESKKKKTSPCINCGKCVEHCPLKLNPVAMSKAYKAGDFEALSKLKVNLCMECGCCSYICPTAQPLVQNHKLAKAALREKQIKK